MRKWKTGTGALSAIAIGLAGVALAACGDDSDGQAGADEAQQQTRASERPTQPPRSASRRT
jgi:hypothetical protein